MPEPKKEGKEHWSKNPNIIFWTSNPFILLIVSALLIYFAIPSIQQKNIENQKNLEKNMNSLKALQFYGHSIIKE